MLEGVSRVVKGALWGAGLKRRKMARPTWQAQRERLSSVILAWSEGAKVLQRRPRSARLTDERLADVLRSFLATEESLGDLCERYLRDNCSWPAELPWPEAVEKRGRQNVVVAAGYWLRYSELLRRGIVSGGAGYSVPLSSLFTSPAERAARPAEIQYRPDVAELGPEFGRLELLYTIKLWQRGPRWVKSLGIDVRPRYDDLIERAYGRLIDCSSTREVACRYYGDGAWVLTNIRDALIQIGEPTSNATLVQDAACWRRYQDIESKTIEAARPCPETSRFAVWLSTEMARQRLSVAVIARRLAVKEEEVWGWLRAESTPEGESCRRLACALDVKEGTLADLIHLAMKPFEGAHAEAGSAERAEVKVGS